MSEEQRPGEVRGGGWGGYRGEFIIWHVQEWSRQPVCLFWPCSFSPFPSKSFSIIEMSLTGGAVSSLRLIVSGLLCQSQRPRQCLVYFASVCLCASRGCCLFVQFVQNKKMFLRKGKPKSNKSKRQTERVILKRGINGTGAVQMSSMSEKRLEKK